MFLDSSELFVVLSGQFQPSFVGFLVGGVIQLLQLAVHPFLAQHQISLHLAQMLQSPLMFHQVVSQEEVVEFVVWGEVAQHPLFFLVVQHE